MPQTFESKWGETISRTMYAYPPQSPGLVLALEQVCLAAQREGEAIGRAKTASDVCDGLHKGPPSGIKCLSCYHAEVNFVEEQNVIAEIAAHNKRVDAEETENE